uniref:Uncharacterized protein n=1 Tax=Avena sativa TaxID=4498 RepID=A0ACD5ZYZ1_AVESA
MLLDLSGRRYKFATHHQLSASHARPVPSILASQLLVHLMDMEMERMLGCQIPAFGVWNYCSDLPITQYFDLAMQQRLLKRGSRRHRRCCTGAAEEEDRRHGSHGERRLVLFSPSPRKPAQIKVIRREVDEQSNVDGGGLLQEVEGGKRVVGVVDTAVKRMVASGAVDEDLYKVPRSLIYQKPRKMRKVVWSLWIGCLGLDCIA